MEKLVYFDTSALSRLNKSFHLSSEFRAAYSRATLLDLQNSTNGTPELNWLVDSKAILLEIDNDNVIGHQQTQEKSSRI